MGNLVNFKDIANKKSFEIKNKSETEADILMYDEIGEGYFGGGITSKAFSEELKKLPSSVKTINLRINSPGGSVFEGMTIYQRLKEHKAKVIAHVDGLSASIATIIMMAADEIIVGEGSMIMIHKPMTGVYGNVDQMEETIDILNKIQNQMINIYRKKTGMAEAEIIKMLAGEGTWMTSDVALEKGFADKSFEAKDSMKLVASALKNDYSWIKSRPNMKNTDALIKDKLKEITKDMKSYLEKK